MKGLDETEVLSDFSRFQVLLLLYEQPRHGYDVLSEFKKRVGKEISPSLVYPFLQKLQEKELVTVSVKKVGRKEKKIYKLTTEGYKLCNHLFKRFASLMSTAIEPNLDTCANCGAKIFEGGHLETVAEKQMVFCCEHCAKAYLVEKGIREE